MDNPLIFQILGVVLVLFFCFLTYMNTRVWRVTHVLFAFLTFAASIGLLVYASLTIKTHSVWKSHAQKLEKQIADEEAKAEKFKYGNLEEIPQVTENVRMVVQKIARETIDRGRVWRDCTVTANDANGVTLSTVPANLAQGAAPKANHLKVKDVVFAFKELLIPEIGAKVPVFYLGKFSVVTPTESSVVLTPVDALDVQQQQEVANVNATWVLYETMPVDSHDVFKTTDKEGNLQSMTEEELRLLMPLERTAFQAAEYDQFIKEFARSGEDALESDLPENKWVQVKFTVPYKVQVDGTSPGIMVIERNSFNQQGQAILPRLQRGGEVEFEPGTEAIFFSDDESVRQLIANNTVTVVKNLFVRPLVDFELVMDHVFERTKQINVRMKELQRDLASIKVADQNILAQIAIKEDEKAKAEEDLKFVKYELAQLTIYEQAQKTQLDAVKNRVRAVYTYTVQQEKALSEITAKLTEEINKRTQEATASK